MKIVIIIVMLLFLASCSQNNRSTDMKPPQVVFENHEYFVTEQYGTNRYSYAHKGNCTTCELKLHKIEQSINSNALTLLLIYKDIKEINNNIGIKEE